MEIEHLINKVAKCKEQLKKSQEAYDTARKQLAESPLLADLGLQLISAKSGKSKAGRKMSEETKRKMSEAQKKWRQAQAQDMAKI
jgi:hypothetical protein